MGVSVRDRVSKLRQGAPHRFVLPFFAFDGRLGVPGAADWYHHCLRSPCVPVPSIRHSPVHREFLRHCHGFDVKATQDTGRETSLEGPADERNVDVEVAVDASPGVPTALDREDRDRGRAVKPMRVLLGRERQGPRVRRRIES